ncbi:phage tail assembly chaperone [Maricaulis sp.]|uniref:phage tail assembly chaperone n=1 Tax=Maricaulis sp. TaxID=1486257 RepID=UPI0030DAAE54|tara:strand:+ start:17714 stop:17896 length:183 start_codon:yes stop_codon:yes gene_type:complete
MSRPDWHAALRLAARLGIAPREFWRLSLIEWRALAGAHDARPLSRAALQILMADYPDKTP